MWVLAKMARTGFLLAVLVGLLWQAPQQISADDKPASPQPEWIDPAGISGSLVICGGGTLPEAVYKNFVQLAGGENAKLVVVPTASDRPESLNPEDLKKRWQELGVSTIEVLHTRDRKQADDPEFLKPIREATAVWFGGGQQSRLAAAYQGTAFETELKRLLERGGVVGGTSAGAAIQSRVMIASGQSEPNIQTGLDLLPGAIIDQHFTERNRQARLRLAVKQHPNCVGFGIDEGTALVVGTRYSRTSAFDRGRTLRVVGNGTVTVMLAASEAKPAKEFRATAGRVLDLVQLRRAARDRVGNFPQATANIPEVPQGALVIIGGGGMPQDVVKKILDLAGGPTAKIVALPTAYEPERAARERLPSYFVQAGATNITLLPARGPEELASPECIKLLQEADCVWFSGGRQWRFVDAYEGTPAMQLFHEVLKRGGVICGSSAGASIQGEYLARADALTNRPIMAEGYERGFHFLPGTAIDQHFSQRNRAGDMQQLIETYPQYLGIGIDEATAIIVQGQVAKVMGRNQVHFFHANERSEAGPLSPTSLSAGGWYDLASRSIIGPARAEPSKQRSETRGQLSEAGGQGR